MEKAVGRLHRRGLSPFSLNYKEEHRRKHLKRTLSILLAMLMLLTMVPMGIASVSAATFGVYIGGIGLVDGEYLPNGSSTTTTTRPVGGYAQYVDRNIGATGMVAMFYFSDGGETLTVRYYSVEKDCYGSALSQFTIDLK